MKTPGLVASLLCLCFVGCASVDLSGKKYSGKPIKSAPKPGFEGMASPGLVNFDKERVSFVLPGSDEKNAGTYTVSGDTVTVKDLGGKTHTFKIKDGGKILQVGSDELRRSDYPWP